jgi:exopolysaccharide biosynthesis protein
MLLNNIFGFAICVLLTQFIFSFSKRKLFSNHFILFLKKYKVSATLYFLLLALTIFTFNLFKVQSNLEYLFKNNGDLMIQTLEGVKELDKVKSNIKYNQIYTNENVNIQSIDFTRKNESFIHRIKNFISPNKVIIIEFESNNHYSVTADVKNNLAPISSFQALKLANANFALNTNLYGRNAIGEIIIEKKRYGYDDSDLSGFFKVINEKPIVGARSLFDKKIDNVSYSTQAWPSVIKNKKLWPYIKDESYQFNWKKKTYRNLIGTLKNGKLVCVLSNKGGLLSVKEISTIALKYGVVNASLFDGGGALQYQYTSEDFDLSFSALNNNFDFGEKIDEIFFTKANTHFPAKSPVYLTIKHFTTTPKLH